MPLDPMIAGPLQRGASDLVGALMGGDAAEAAANEKRRMTAIAAQSAEAGLDKKITDAFLARDKRKAQQSYEADFISKGDAPEVARIKANAMIGGGANLLQAQGYGIRDQLPALYQADGMSAGNALAASFASKPVSSVDIDNGNIIRDRFGATPTITETDETLGKIAARALTSGAQARLSNVKADAGGWNPATGGGGGGGGHKSKGTQMENARAIIDDLAGVDRGAAMGYSPRDVKTKIAAGLDFTPLRAAQPGEIRMITADGVRNIPMGKPPNGNAAVPIDTVEARPVKSVNRPKPSGDAVKLLWSNPALSDKFATRYGRAALEAALASKP